MSYQGTKRSKSCRIYEYFNEEMAKIRPKKTGSDYTLHPKGVAYFCGAGAYVFECLLLTDCFKTKVPHKEMFMVYCLGPLYLIMGLGYILK